MRDEFGRFSGMFILITFDIMEKPDKPSMQKRLRQATKILLGFGQRVQKSVFECYLDKPQINILQDKLAKVIDIEAGDNIRFYQICNSCFEKILVIGERQVSQDEEFYIF